MAEPLRKIKTGNSVASFLQEVFVNQKLNNWLGYFLIGGMAAIFAFLISKNLYLGLGFLGVVLGSLVLLGCLLDAELGLYLNMIYIFFVYFFVRLFFEDDFPLGVISDVLVSVTFLGLFVKNQNLKRNAAHFLKAKPVVFLLIAFGYLCLQLLNPLAHSFEGWFSVIRKVLSSILVMFIAYSVFTDYKKIWRFLKVLFVCALIAALYGCFQQWHGLFGFEQAWVRSNDVRFGLIFVGWNYRKFSVMSDPTALGLIMASCALLFIIIGLNERRTSSKAFLLGGALFMVLAMAYSGTRTANAMLVAGAGLFVLLTIQKKATKIFAFFAVLAFLFLMYAPIYNNATIIRFRTSFSGSKNESYMVREENREAIQPYIYKHPFGGGLSTTGGNGEKYNPDHYLAGFPPDSGYLNKALETGWVGLAINCLLYFVTLLYAVKGFFRAKSNRIKTLFAATAVFLFSFYLAELVQEAVGLIANMIIYNSIVAMIIRLRELSTKEKDEWQQEQMANSF
jgi:hypothetical protein